MVQIFPKHEFIGDKYLINLTSEVGNEGLAKRFSIPRVKIMINLQNYLQFKINIGS